MSDDNEDKEESKSESTASTIKSISTLLASIVALITATGSWMKPQDTTALQKSYETLSNDIEKLSEENVKQQETIIALKTMVDVVLKTSIIERDYANDRASHKNTLVNPRVLFQTFEHEDVGETIEKTDAPEPITPVEIKPFEQVIK